MTADHRAIEDSVAKICAQFGDDYWSECDEAPRFPSEFHKAMADAGWLGIAMPEELGGAGLGYVDYALAVEELSAVDGSIGIIVASHNSLCANHIFVAGNEAQKSKYIPLLASGKWLGAWGLTEPGSGSDAGSARTRLQPRSTRVIVAAI